MTVAPFWHRAAGGRVARSACYTRALVALAGRHAAEYTAAYEAERARDLGRSRGFAQQRAYRLIRDRYRAEFDALYDAQKPSGAGV